MARNIAKRNAIYLNLESYIIGNLNYGCAKDALNSNNHINKNLKKPFLKYKSIPQT